MQTETSKLPGLSRAVVPVFSRRKASHRTHRHGNGFFVTPLHFLTSCELAERDWAELSFFDLGSREMRTAVVIATRQNSNLALARINDGGPDFPSTLPLAPYFPETRCPVYLFGYNFRNPQALRRSRWKAELYPIQTVCPCGRDDCYFAEGEAIQIRMKRGICRDWNGAPVVDASGEVLAMSSDLEVPFEPPEDDMVTCWPEAVFLGSALPAMRDLVDCYAASL